VFCAAAGQNTSDIHLGKGYEALRQDRYDAAVDEFRAALELDPKLVMRARFPLAVALFELKKSDDARREFEAVRRAIGEHPNVSYYLGRLDLLDQNFAGAIQHFNQAIAKPPFPDTAYYLGFACFEHGDLAAAEKWLNVAVKSNPRDSVAQYQLARVYRKQGREEEAAKIFALSVEIRKRDADETQVRAECAKKLDEGPRQDARALCQRLFDPNDPERLTALGTIYGQHGDLEAALEPLQKAAQLAPQSPQMQYNLAFTYYRLNRFEEARAPLREAIAGWPDLFPLNALYGAVLSKLGEDQLAYQSLRRAHQLNPQDPGAAESLYTVTLTMAQKSQDARAYSDALNYLDEALNMRPNDPRPHRSKAEIYALTGRSGEAEAERQKADHLKKDDRNP
jgi:tetratricopeptide (TPR) repeat protein